MEGDQANKPSRAKQMIAMEMIDDEHTRLITFSKRRSRIYKKASELITLGGAEVAVVIFSPSGKLFSFGHPSADEVVDKFMDNGTAPKLKDSAKQRIMEAYRIQKVEELNEVNNSLFDLLRDEKVLGKALTKKLSEVSIISRSMQQWAVGLEDEEDEEEQQEVQEVLNKEKQWWKDPLNGLTIDALEDKYRSLEKLHNKFNSHVKERLTKANSSCFGGNVPPPSLPQGNFQPSSGVGVCFGKGFDAVVCGGENYMPRNQANN